MVCAHGIGGPAATAVGFGYMEKGLCVWATAKLESLRRDPRHENKPAWTTESLVSFLRVLPAGHRVRQSPFYDFTDANGRGDPAMWA